MYAPGKKLGPFNLLSFNCCWFQCSTTCDRGIMTRELECIRVNERGKAVPAIDILCQHAIKPSIQIICNEENPCSGKNIEHFSSLCSFT